MFDVGLSELMVIAVVGLIVIGPERLPKVAKMLGHLLGRAQRYVNQVKSDINREIELDELKKLQNDVQDSMRDLEKNIQEQMHQVEEGVEQTMEPVKELIAEASENDKGTLAHIQIEAPQYRYPHAEEVAQEPPIESAEPNKQITDQR